VTNMSNGDLMATFLFDLFLFYAGFIIGLFSMNWMYGSINNVNDHHWE